MNIPLPIPIASKAYKKRRIRLIDQLPDNSIVIMATANETYRTPTMPYPFCPDPNFYYLTGFSEPQAVLVLITAQNRSVATQSGHFILFNRFSKPQKEQWLGKFAGEQGALNDYGADEAYDIGDLPQQLPRLLQGCRYIFYSLAANRLLADILQPWFISNQGCYLSDSCYYMGQKQDITTAMKTKPASFNWLTLIDEMRLIKEGCELEYMRYVAKVSAKAHIRAMQRCRVGMYEYQLQAELTQVFLNHGCLHYPYWPIVATGNNACVLHYSTNQSRLDHGELILIDAGAEYQYYAADLTRTYPVNGRFSDCQRLLYQVVLQAQLVGMRQLKVGSNYQQFVKVIQEVITEGLVELGLLKGNINNLIDQQAYSLFYPHGPGHFLGLEVHDVGSYQVNGGPRSFEAGMVITNEPGIYIPFGTETVDPCWWGIGVRIEDDVLICQDSFEVLTETAPKTIYDIEQIMLR